MYGYKAWAVYSPVDPNTGSQEGYTPSVHKQSSGDSRVGDGWCTSVVAVNLSETFTTTVEVEIFDSTDGSVAYTEQRDLPPSGKTNWYTLESYLDADLGSTFFGGAKVTVMGGPGPIIVSAQQSGSGYPTSDAYGFYNGIIQ
jgi:hypothetical protein